MTTVIECVISVNGATYSPGPADASGSCAAYPGSVPTSTTVTQDGGTPTTTTTTTVPTVPTIPTQPVDGSPGACGPPGFAGCSGGGLNGGAGPVVTSAPATTVPVAPQPLAFTGAPIGLEIILALALVGLGAALRRLATA